jgi:hypothetical protein
MRIELETFVNAGLQEGWGGWPLKEGHRMSRTLVLPLRAALEGLWRRQDSGWILPGGPLGALRVGCRYNVEN